MDQTSEIYDPLSCPPPMPAPRRIRWIPIVAVVLAILLLGTSISLSWHEYTVPSLDSIIARGGIESKLGLINQALYDQFKKDHAAVAFEWEMNERGNYVFTGLAIDKPGNPLTYLHNIEIEFFLGSRMSEGNVYLAQEIFNKTKRSYEQTYDWKTYSETAHQYYGFSRYAVDGRPIADFNNSWTRAALVLHTPGTRQSESDFQNTMLCERCFRVLEGISVPCILSSSDIVGHSVPYANFRNDTSHIPTNVTFLTTYNSSTVNATLSKSAPYVSNLSDIHFITLNSQRGFKMECFENYSNKTAVPYYADQNPNWALDMALEMYWLGEKPSNASYLQRMVTVSVNTGLMWPYDSLDSLVTSLVSKEWITVGDTSHLQNISHFQGCYTTISGNSAYKVTFITKQTLGDEILTLKMMYIGIVKNGTYYLFKYGADPENYDYYMPVVQHMINSFKVTGATTPSLPPAS
ncbi:MAG: hypothetical protein ACXV3D_03385 [Halobacteriota archaeon]